MLLEKDGSHGLDLPFTSHIYLLPRHLATYRYASLSQSRDAHCILDTPLSASCHAIAALIASPLQSGSCQGSSCVASHHRAWYDQSGESACPDSSFHAQPLLPMTSYRYSTLTSPLQVVARAHRIGHATLDEDKEPVVVEALEQLVLTRSQRSSLSLLVAGSAHLSQYCAASQGKACQRGSHCRGCVAQERIHVRYS